MRTLGYVPSEHQLERHLAAIHPSSNGGADILVGEELTDRQYAEFRGSQQVLVNILELAPAYAVQDQVSDFESTLLAIGNDLTNRRTTPAEAARRIGTATDNVLSTVRGFIDKTPRLLARTWSDAESVVALFKHSLKFVYDSSVEYRIGYQLRNYSQHAGLFPDVKRREWLDDDQVVRTTFEATLDADHLLNDFEKWGATVRRDLEELTPRKLHIEEIVRQLGHLVDIIWSSLLLVLEGPLVSAAERLRELDARAPQVADASTHVVSYRAPLKGINMHDEYIRMDLADLLSVKLAQCAQLLPDETVT